MKKINLAITGCLGRMGQQLIKSSKSNNNFRLVTLTENRIISRKFNGIKPQANTEIAFEKTDIIIDFTVPKCTIEVLKIASKLKKRVVIGTTGFTQKEDKIIKNYSKKIPILLAFNMSKGIFIIKKSIQDFLESNNNKLNCTIEEVHHTEKVDSPSGTALELKKVIEIADIANNILSLNIESKRVEDVFGIHKVIFSSDSDYIEFKHEALSRKVFAEGAIEISKLISSKSPKMYDLEDFFNAE